MCVHVVAARYERKYINAWDRLTIPRYFCIYHFGWLDVCGCVHAAYMCLCSCCRTSVFMLWACACVHAVYVRLCSRCGCVLVFMLCMCDCVHVVYVRLCSCCGALMFMLQLGLGICQSS